MDRPFVERLRVQNYGCIKDAALTLTPLHALIGPNDSGKSTILRALRTLAVLHSPAPRRAEEEEALERAFVANTKRGPVTLDAIVQGNTLRISCAGLPNSPHWEWTAMTTERPNYGSRAWQGGKLFMHAPLYDYLSSQGRAQASARALAGAQLLRLDPDALRAPHALIPEGQPLRFADEKGSGLPAIYDAIMIRNLDAYLAIRAELAGLFPNVQSISLVNSSVDKKAMGVRIADGTFVPAEHMSEGLLYYLAFAALRHMDPAAVLLVEEPENGIHPARIAEVMRVLREISKTTQVLIATHSPLVINALEGDEVTLVTRSPEGGTTGVLMKDTPGFEERSKVYELGELWASYANGVDEAPLLRGLARSGPASVGRAAATKA